MLEYLEATAPRLPDKVAFHTGAEGLTFGQVSRAARGIGTFLARKGLERESSTRAASMYPLTRRCPCTEWS